MIKTNKIVNEETRELGYPKLVIGDYSGLVYLMTSENTGVILTDENVGKYITDMEERNYKDFKGKLELENDYE